MMQLPLRLIRVEAVQPLTPHLTRVTFSTPDPILLDGPDQQVKLYFPRPGQTVPRLPARDSTSFYQDYLAIPDAERPWMRSFTIRFADPLRIDFVLHGVGPDSGPACSWARTARPGQVLGMFGPSAEYARPVPLLASVAEADWVLMVGDDTALPAIGTLVEALPVGARAVAYLEVDDEDDEVPLSSAADLTVHWIHRRSYGSVARSVRGAVLPPGSVFAWLAGEAGMVRAVRRQLVDERGVPKRSIDFCGYWRARLTQDDNPTPEDLADAQEMLARAASLLQRM
jgi:NADPH-dependent ferric siderophore reductase